MHEEEAQTRGLQENATFPKKLSKMERHGGQKLEADRGGKEERFKHD